MIKNIVFSPRKRLLSVFVCDTIPRDEGFALIFLCGTGQNSARAPSARGGLLPKQSGGKRPFPSQKIKIAGENNGPQVIL